MDYFSRAQWGARYGHYNASGRKLDGRLQRLFVHHWAFDVADNIMSERSAMRSVEREHTNRGWDGIGYHWVVFPSGRMYEGRGWGRSGAHVDDYNHSTYGLAYAADGRNTALTDRAIVAFREIIADGVSREFIAKDHECVGHRDFDATVCPGDKVYAQIPNLEKPLATQPAEYEEEDVISFGDTGPSVTVLQQKLNAYSRVYRPDEWDDIEVTGKYDPATRQRVRWFKHGKHVIPGDSAFHPLDWTVLELSLAKHYVFDKTYKAK